MFVEETLWIRDVLEKELPEGDYEILDIGSSSLEYRTKTQPHIYKNIHRPLERRGCAITYADIKNDAGIDMVIDLSADNLPESFFEKQYDLVICCNILEHVVNRGVFLKNLARFVKKGGYALFTVPRRYPKHNDPIDTMYRPTPKALLEDIENYMEIRDEKQAVLSIKQKRYYTRRPGRILDYLTLKPFWYIWRYYLGFMCWQVTCVLVNVEDVCRLSSVASRNK